MRHKVTLRNTTITMIDTREGELKWFQLNDNLKLVDIGLKMIRASGKQMRVMLW